MDYRVVVLRAGKIELPHGWKITECEYVYYHLLYLLSGSISILIGDRTAELLDGHYVIIPPNMRHEVLEATVSGTELWEVKFDVLDTYLSDRLLLSGLPFRDNHYVHTALKHVVEYWSSAEPRQRMDVDYLLSAMLLSVSSDNSDRRVSNYSSFVDTSILDEIPKKIIAYIEENHIEKFSLSVMARDMGYNRNYLCSVFKQGTGITIVDYLNYVRVRRAAECFFYNGSDVLNVCKKVGFKSTGHFSRTFKKLTGISPGLYRKTLSSDRHENRASHNAFDTYFLSRAPTIGQAMNTMQCFGDYFDNAK